MLSVQIRSLIEFLNFDLQTELRKEASPFRPAYEKKPQWIESKQLADAVKALQSLLESKRAVLQAQTREGDRQSLSDDGKSQDLGGPSKANAAVPAHPDETSLMWGVTEKLYASWPIRIVVFGVIVALGVAIAIAMGGSFVIGGQSFNIVQNVDKARESVEAKMSAVRQDLDKARESAETKIRTITESTQNLVARESQEQIAALRERATGINSQLTRAEQEVAKLNAGSDKIKNDIVSQLQTDLAARASSLRDEILAPLVKLRDNDLNEISSRLAGLRKTLTDLVNRTTEEDQKLSGLGPTLGRMNGYVDQVDRIAKALLSINSDQDAARIGRAAAQAESILAVRHRQTTESLAKDAERLRNDVATTVKNSSEEAAKHNRALAVADAQLREFGGKLAALEARLSTDVAAEEVRLRAARERITALDSQIQKPTTPPARPEAAPPKPISLADLKPDDRKQIQRRLAEEGMAVRKIDGNFGKRTIAAIQAYQRKMKAEVTGQLTPEQIATLLKPKQP